jgi:hypothetical protein
MLWSQLSAIIAILFAKKISVFLKNPGFKNDWVDCSSVPSDRLSLLQVCHRVQPVHLLLPQQRVQVNTDISFGPIVGAFSRGKSLSFKIC